MDAPNITESGVRLTNNAHTDHHVSNHAVLKKDTSTVLAKEFGMVEVKAFIHDPSRAKKKTANASRQEAFLERKKNEGLSKQFIPLWLADAIKQEGGIEGWRRQQLAEMKPNVVVVEKTIEKQLSQTQVHDIQIGRQVRKLSGWRRSIVDFAMGL